jgi:tetratricopeptide (TPR) repeat protein
MGLILEGEYRPREAETEFKRAIELKPSYATAHQWYSSLLAAEQRWEEARQHIEKAVELDPFSIIINTNHAQLYSSMRDFERAVELYEKAIELDPNFGSAHWELAYVYGRLKMFDKMEKEAEIGNRLLKDYLPGITLIGKAVEAFLRSDKKTVERLLPDLEAHESETPAGAMEIASLYLFVGKTDEAFEFLEKAYLRKEPGLLTIKNDDALDAYRSDPRYLDLLKRLGLS